MNGIIKTCLNEKRYGFIKGDDGKDYYFKFSSFLSNVNMYKICENLCVEFDQKATPKGYSAIKIKILGEVNIGYLAPDEFISSKNSSVKGYDILDDPGWFVCASSTGSLDSAKYQMQQFAKMIGANSLLDVNYIKTTDNDGNYYFSIHHFVGRAVNIGKKSPNGKDAQSFICINEHATKIKKELTNKSSRSKIWAFFLWLIVFAIMTIVANAYHWFWCIVIFLLAFRFISPTNYDSWLQKDRQKFEF